MLVMMMVVMMAVVMVVGGNVGGGVGGGWWVVVGYGEVVAGDGGTGSGDGGGWVDGSWLVVVVVVVVHVPHQGDPLGPAPNSPEHHLGPLPGPPRQLGRGLRGVGHHQPDRLIVRRHHCRWLGRWRSRWGALVGGWEGGRGHCVEGRVRPV